MRRLIETEKEKLRKIWIKKVIITIVCILVIVITLKYVYAFDIGFVKWTLCDNLNLTKWDCDQWWEDPANPYWTGYSLNNTLNESYVSGKLKDYYNKSETIKIMNDIVSGNMSSLNNSNFNESYLVPYITQTRFDNWTREFRENIFEDIDDLKEDVRDLSGNQKAKSGVSDVSDTTILVIGAILFIVAGGFYLFNKKQKTDQAGAMGQPSQRKIHKKPLQSKESLSFEEKIRQLEAKLEEKEEKPRKKKKKSKPEPEEELEEEDFEEE